MAGADERENTIREAFRRQADACADLGSPFTARLCHLFAERLSTRTAVGSFALSWPGDASGAGDSIPLRLCGALNYLALTGRAAELSRTWPPEGAPMKFSDTRLWRIIDTVLGREGEAVIAFMASPPQTNEVRRSAVLIPVIGAIATRFALPIRLLELGASAGLNLALSRFRLETGELVAGDSEAELVLRPEWRGEKPSMADFRIDSARGCDIAPIDLRQDENALRLLSYIWPDQDERVSLTRKAIEMTRASGICVDRADAASWLEQRLAEPAQGVLRVVQHTIAWQYFSPSDSGKCEELFSIYGARADESTPLARISMEADGSGPGASVRLTLWPGGTTHDLGRADFHGRWIDWRNLPTVPTP